MDALQRVHLWGRCASWACPFKDTSAFGNVRSLPHFLRDPQLSIFSAASRPSVFYFQSLCFRRRGRCNCTGQLAAECLRVPDGQQILSWVHEKARSVYHHVKRVALVVIVSCHLLDQVRNIHCDCSTVCSHSSRRCSYRRSCSVTPPEYILQL
jgi:hypothetical protein